VDSVVEYKMRNRLPELLQHAIICSLCVSLATINDVPSALEPSRTTSRLISDSAQTWAAVKVPWRSEPGTTQSETCGVGTNAMTSPSPLASLYRGGGDDDGDR
jgi:hypothetical protein